MNGKQTEQPAAWGCECDVCGAKDWQKTHPGACEGCDGMRAAAAAYIETRFGTGRSSLQRVGRLCARWREQAATMEELALDSTDDSQDQIECYERMRTLRDCAEALERELAGTEPTEPS